jgi:hypothetical protein
MVSERFDSLRRDSMPGPWTTARRPGSRPYPPLSPTLPTPDFGVSSNRGDSDPAGFDYSDPIRQKKSPGEGKWCSIAGQWPNSDLRHFVAWSTCIRD